MALHPANDLIAYLAQGQKPQENMASKGQKPVGTVSQNAPTFSNGGGRLCEG
jgi:hypothetical protein